MATCLCFPPFLLPVDIAGLGDERLQVNFGQLSVLLEERFGDAVGGIGYDYLYFGYVVASP